MPGVRARKTVADEQDTPQAHPRRAEQTGLFKGWSEPWRTAPDPDTRVYIGDCRQTLACIPEVDRGEVDLVFADPPFNWNRDYDRFKGRVVDESAADYATWQDAMTRGDYLDFTFDWIDACVKGLRPSGSLFINIPDDTAAEIVCFLKGQLARRPWRPMFMVNWCVWHYRFGQNRTDSFVNSKVHCLYFSPSPGTRVWNPLEVLEPSDRATTYFDPRTKSKRDGMPPGMRVPLDVWYGPYWGRVQGNNAERRGNHDNQLPEVYLNRVIRCASNPGMLVLDPFLGSGTTGVIARALGRRFIGCEYSAANARSAWERVLAGPARALSTYDGLSTAIHKPRRVGKRTPPR
ncbi:MAG: site-specific DNA-methyltransferase [Phycisphaerales bacterium]|nr:site-specific DNA-methyltransferase [Phycisphaerales bacterium]